ncbi:hypothetical protein R3P38DRAFT_1767713 [Favolaschia claudopus]|uniref:Uncharacterized protein n=1 Tax=Favolaschia claudopus TaxID=2862362 RepID=A0AAW0A7C6_9AGAR
MTFRPAVNCQRPRSFPFVFIDITEIVGIFPFYKNTAFIDAFYQSFTISLDPNVKIKPQITTPGETNGVSGIQKCYSPKLSRRCLKTGYTVSTVVGVYTFHAFAYSTSISGSDSGKA